VEATYSLAVHLVLASYFMFSSDWIPSLGLTGQEPSCMYISNINMNK